MRSQHKQNRRSRGNKPQDDDQFGTSRMDGGSDSYSRSHRPSHRSDDRRTPSAPNRDYYDGYRDTGSRSRSLHDEDPWYSDVARYREEDVYRRDDDYEAGLRRDSSWGPRPQGDPQYSGMRDEWAHQHYDHPSSYHDSSSWGTAASRDAYDSRSSYYDDWQAPNTRSSSSHGRDDDRHLRHGEKHDHEDLGWHGEQRRDKSTQQTRYQNDSGWDVRRRDNGWEDKMTEDPQSVEERAWEPAPSWKSSHRNEGTPQNRNQNQSNHQRNTQLKQQQYSKGGKRNMNTKQRRDWRNDESSLNNWTRRDFNTQNRKTGRTQQQQPQQPQYQQQHQQRHKQYHSRSRSRSPAESYHSRISSYGRSRSRTRSPVPKRRRREPSPTQQQQSPTPSDRDVPTWVPRQEQDIHPRSPSARHGSQPQQSRRQSVSSLSSRTSDHSSRSSSPKSKPRAVHRLPSLDPVLPMTLENATRNIQHGNSRQFPSHSNGNHTHDRRNKSKSDWLPEASTANPRFNDEPMPPPSVIPPPKNAYSSPENLASEPPPTRVNISSRPNRTLPGFKPLSRPQPASSSSLRKFFPGDDDDAEQPPLTDPLPPSPLQQHERYRPSPHPTPPIAKGVWPPPEQQDLQPQSSSWPVREPTNYDHTGLTFNGHVPINHSPQSAYDIPWNEDETTRHALVPATSGLRDHSQKLSPQNIVEPTGNPSRPSPAPRHISPSPPSLSTPPPLSSALPPSSSASTLEDQRRSQAPKNVIPLSGKAVYNIVTQVGEGTFGKVYKARNSVSNLLVALKRIRMETEKDGFPVTAMREIKLLQLLRHENIVRLYEMIVSNGSVYMVFEYMDHDLTGILSQTQFEFTAAHLKSLCHQMLAGLAYLHHKGVIHRDIKGSNILINNRGELKLGDFGLARFYQKRRRTDYTNRVITLWYRPPELLFGATVYGPEVDMWSAGCIMLELFTKKPVFQGNDEIHQLDVIHRILGTPTPHRWPALVDLPWYELAKPREEIPNRFRDIFQKWMSTAALDLAEQLFAYDPIRRISATQAMETPYFTQEAPNASLPIGLATLEGEWHELETKRERAKKRKKNESSA